MHRVDADLNGHRQQHRHQDGDRRDGFHEAANNQHKQRYDQQNGDLVVGKAQQQVGELVGHLVGGQDPAKDRRGGDDHQNRGGHFNGVHRHPHDRFPIEGAVDHHTEEHRVHDRRNGRFRGGKQPGNNAADDDYRRHQRQGGLDQRVPEDRKPEAIVTRIAPPLGVPRDHDHQGKGHQHPGNQPGGEQLANRGIRHHAIDHQRQGRRDDRPDGRGRGGDADGKIGVIAGVAHRLDLDVSQAASVGHGRAGHAGEDHAGPDVHVSQAAVHPADHGAGEAENLGGDPGGIHQMTGQDEEGYGNQRKGVHAVDHVMQHHQTGHAVGDDKDQRRQTKGHRHRDADNQQHKQQRKKQQDRHSASYSEIACSSSSAMTWALSCRILRINQHSE